MSVKLLGFYAEKSQDKRDKGTVGDITFEVDRQGREILVERRYETDAGEWKNFTVARCSGVVTGGGTIRTNAKGEFIMSPIVLTYEEKQQLLDEAAARAKEMKDQKPATRRF
jgi:hypothetical protein